MNSSRSELRSLDTFWASLEKMKQVEESGWKPGSRNAVSVMQRVINRVNKAGDKQTALEIELDFRKRLENTVPWKPDSWTQAHVDMGTTLSSVFSSSSPPPYLLDVIKIVRNQE